MATVDVDGKVLCQLKPGDIIRAQVGLLLVPLRPLLAFAAGL